MVYRIIRHPLVDDDFYDIADFISGYSGPATALAKVEDIVRAIDNLADFPHVGSIRNEVFEGLRAIPAGQKGVVCFTIDEEDKTVFIICVTYAGADWSERVGQRR